MKVLRLVGVESGSNIVVGPEERRDTVEDFVTGPTTKVSHPVDPGEEVSFRRLPWNK